MRTAAEKTHPSISFLGAGALAGALARLLREQGYRIAEIITRNQPAPASLRRAHALAREVGASAVTLSGAKLNCDVLWLAVPDEAIEEVAGQVADKVAARGALPKLVQPKPVHPKPVQPKIALHPSGALSSHALRALAKRGVETGSAHPMMTFVAGTPPSLEGVWFAVEGTPAAVRAARAMARRLGAKSFVIEPEKKALYHAFGAMLSPMLATELEAAERVGLRAGISAKQVRRIMEPIVLRTVCNVLRNGAAHSFSGPLARGDVATVAAHLRALNGALNSAAPESALPESAVYRALMAYATETLPVKRAEEMKKLLRPRGAGFVK